MPNLLLGFFSFLKKTTCIRIILDSPVVRNVHQCSESLARCILYDKCYFFGIFLNLPHMGNESGDTKIRKACKCRGGGISVQFSLKIKTKKTGFVTLP